MRIRHNLIVGTTALVLGLSISATAFAKGPPDKHPPDRTPQKGNLASLLHGTPPVIFQITSNNQPIIPPTNQPFAVWICNASPGVTGKVVLQRSSEPDRPADIPFPACLPFVQDQGSVLGSGGGGNTPWVVVVAPY